MVSAALREPGVAPTEILGLPTVEATLRFSVAQESDPIVYLVAYEDTTIRLEDRRVEIADARSKAHLFDSETHGFQLVPFSTTLTDVGDEEGVERIYRPAAEAMLASLLGARRVVMWHYLARNGRKQAGDKNLGAALNVHIDHDQETYEAQIRGVLPPDEADACLAGRWAIYNLWKPLERVERNPLAVMDARTADEKDLILTYVGTRPGEPLLPKTGYGILYNPEQRFYYFSNMTADEALVIKMWDSDRTRPHLTAHSSFEDPTSAPGAPPRVSSDSRFLVIY